MLRLAIAGVVVALFATTDVNGQEESASNQVCYISVISDNGFFWVYEAEDCVTGEIINAIGDPHQTVGGDCASGGNGCYSNPAPESLFHFHPKFPVEKRKKALAYMEKNSTEVFSRLFAAIRSVHRELTVSYLSTAE